MSNIKKIFVNMLLASLFGPIVFAQNAEMEPIQNKKNDTIYFKSVALFKCGIKLPKNYDPNKSYKLVIGLHGGGSSIEKFINIWDDVENTDFIYAVPQGPYAWFLNEKFGYDWALWPTGKIEHAMRATNLIPTYIVSERKR